MSAHDPKSLLPGIYWYIAPGKKPVICERRIDENFVRFTDGGRQSWIGPDDRFDGPIFPPKSNIGKTKNSMFSKLIDTLLAVILNLAFSFERSENNYVEECRRRERRALVAAGGGAFLYFLAWVTANSSVQPGGFLPLVRVTFLLGCGFAFAGLVANAFSIYWVYRRFAIDAELANGSLKKD